MSILDIKSGIIVHSVNCQGVMGCGLALALRTKYLSIYPSYRKYCQSHYFRPGMVQFINVDENLWICNLAGQDRYGRDKRYTDYEAMREGLKKVRIWREMNHPELTVYIPCGIGCGNGGGDWEVVKKIIEETIEAEII